MTDRELMQQALEKLVFFAHMKSVSEDTMRLIADMRERLAQPWEKFCDANCTCADHHPNCKLAQPEQEPVGYFKLSGFNVWWQVSRADSDIQGVVPLYTTPPWSTVHAAVKRAIDQCKAASGMHRAIELVVNATQLTHEAMGTDTANSITGEKK